MTMHVLYCPRCHSALTCTPKLHTCPSCGWTRYRKGRIWLVDRELVPVGFDDAAATRLQLMQGHFWIRGRRLLVDRLLRRLAVPGHRVVELGCGTGELLPLLEHRFARVTAVDAHATLLEKAAASSIRAELFQADVAKTTLPDREYDFVVAMDLIEHVDPDAFLTEARRIVGPRGLLLLSAPAAPSLWSRMDEMAGHRCRYTRTQLADELLRNGWVPEGFTHYQCLLFPLVWLSNVLGKRADAAFERQPPGWLDCLLGRINSLEIALFGNFSLPYGSSLFMWARSKTKVSG